MTSDGTQAVFEVKLDGRKRWIVTAAGLRLQGRGLLPGLVAVTMEERGGCELILEPRDFAWRDGVPDEIAAWQANRVLLTESDTAAMRLVGGLSDCGAERLEHYRSLEPRTRDCTLDDVRLERAAHGLSAGAARRLYAAIASDGPPASIMDLIGCGRHLPFAVLERFYARGLLSEAVDVDGPYVVPLGYGEEVEVLEHLARCRPHRFDWKLVLSGRRPEKPRGMIPGA